MNQRVKISAFLLFFLLLGGGWFLAPRAEASYLQSLIGWIWGGMDQTGGGNTGLGWISLNSRDCDDDGDGTVNATEAAASPGCPTGAIPDYGVDIPINGSGLVTGYGWTENYGWISFNASDVAGCPSGACRAERAGNRVIGWARILSIRDNPTPGGWTGFLKLASDATDSVSYGVTINSQNLTGYAYSDEIGWIDFTGARISPPKKLWVCEDSCSSNRPKGEAGNPRTFTMAYGSPSQHLVACYTDTNECTDTNPTANNVSANWSEEPINTVSLTPVSNGRRLDALAPGNENISAVYSGQTATMTVLVTCVENTCKAIEDEQVCEGEEYTIPSFCGVSGGVRCVGVRSCDSNWKEVAP